VEQQPPTLEGLHVVVTGGGTGIGAAIAQAFGGAAAKLTLLGRRPGPLDEQVRALTADGVSAASFSCDLTDPDAAAGAFAKAVEAQGPVQILVNNAGMAESASFAQTTPELVRKVFDANVTQVFHCTRQVMPRMVEAGFGRIINIASTAGLTGYPYVTAYCAAKHAVLGLTRSLALEVVRTGVTVNAVCPGYTETPLVDGAIEKIHAKSGRDREALRKGLSEVNPMGRMIRPDEVADAVLWVASPGSASITGQAIVVAGGEVMTR
jgi:NAD(P)-dependent dehydrogenase (short-subunit alcohol dehydrogenase family)